jgi:hypothetical protein
MATGVLVDDSDEDGVAVEANAAEDDGNGNGADELLLEPPRDCRPVPIEEERQEQELPPIVRAKATAKKEGRMTAFRQEHAIMSTNNGVQIT